MRDAHVGVVADHGEVVRGAAVGAHEDHVVHDLGGEGHVPVHRIVEFDRSVVERHLQAPNVRLACADTSFDLIARKVAARAVVAGVAALRFSAIARFSSSSSFRAEARVDGVALAQRSRASAYVCVRCVWK